MLTVEGREVANECILRSGLPDSVDILSVDEMDPTPQAKKTPNQNPTCSFTMREELPYVDPRCRAQSAIPSDILEKVLHHNVIWTFNSSYTVLIGLKLWGRGDIFFSSINFLFKIIGFLQQFTPFGYSKEQVVAAFREVSDGSGDKDPSTLWLSVMCHLRQAEVYNSCPDSRNSKKDSSGPFKSQIRTVFMIYCA